MEPYLIDPLLLTPDDPRLRMLSAAPGHRVHAPTHALAGLSVPYGVASGVKYPHDFEAFQGWRLQLYFEPGSFALSVERAAAGLSDIPLVAEHRYESRFASTGAGTLRLFEEADGLKFVAAEGAVPDGWTGCQCSAGFGLGRYEPRPISGGVMLVRVFSAALTEITLTTIPLFRETWTHRLRPGA